MFLLIYAHPDPDSFNAAIKSQVISTLESKKQAYKLIDLYAEKFDPVMGKEEMKDEVTSDAVKRYREMIKEASTLVFVFPVWWFRGPAILEGFLDKVFTAGFAYHFKHVIGKYGMPIPLLKDKDVLTIITHGSPALPVKTIYVNAVKYRFLLGFLSFCFNIFKCKIVQLWSVPFVSEKKRKKYLERVERLVEHRIP